MPSVEISNIDSFINYVKKPNILCLYYWNNCPHCIEFKPIWKKITNRNINKAITSIMVELEVLKGLEGNNLKKYNIQAFPTIKIHNASGNRTYVFNKERTESNLQDFINKHLLLSKN